MISNTIKTSLRNAARAAMLYGALLALGAGGAAHADALTTGAKNYKPFAVERIDMALAGAKAAEGYFAYHEAGARILERIEDLHALAARALERAAVALAAGVEDHAGIPLLGGWLVGGACTSLGCCTGLGGGRCTT